MAARVAKITSSTASLITSVMTPGVYGFVGLSFPTVYKKCSGRVNVCLL
jgi:hypothetical protein